MRTTGDLDMVRLYRLGEDGSVETLFYGPLAQAMDTAARLPDGQGELYVQTDNDVIAVHDLAGDR